MRFLFSLNDTRRLSVLRQIFLLLGLMQLIAVNVSGQEFAFEPQRFWNRYNATNTTLIPTTPGASYDHLLGETKHDKWDYMLATSTWTTEFKFKSIANVVRAGIDWDQSHAVSNYKYRVDLQLIGKTAPGGADVTKSVTLVVEYNKDSLQVHNDQSAFKLDAGFHSFTTRLVGLYDISGATPVAVDRSALIRNFFIETEILVQRYDLFTDTRLVIQAINPYVKGGEDLRLSWGFYGTGTPVIPTPCNTMVALNYPRTPLMYELEWQYIDDYQVAMGASGETVANAYTNPVSGGAPALNYDFRNNATRVRTWNTSYNIPAVYERGVIVFRVRYIRPNATNYEQLKYSAWSSPDSGSIGFSNDLCFRNNAGIVYLAHQNDSINWQYSVNFAEEGKYKHVLNYFDGSGNSRQTQTKINTDIGYVVAADKIYDYEGRPSIQTLPVPVQSGDLYYKPDISLHNTTGLPYKAADFDLGCLADSIAPFKNTAQAFKYYSTLNPDKTGMQQFVPDAEGYPFVETIYSADNTNKVVWQGGAGRDFQRWKKHGTRYAYVRAQQTELNRLMGAEAGWFEYYPKQIVTDANGQSSYTIFNPDGKVAATALLGTPPSATTTPISPLSSLPTPTSTVPVNLLAKMTQGVADGKRVAEHSFFSEAAGLTKLKYGVAIPPYNAACSSKYINLQARYDVKVVDDCGNVQMQQQGTAGTTGITTSTASQHMSAAEISGTLAVDKYTIVKELYFPDTAITRLASEFTDLHTGIGNCYVYQDSFVRKTVEAATLPCVAGDTITSCEALKKRMIREMYPGEKYGQYTKSAIGGFANAGGNSIFSYVSATGGTAATGVSPDSCAYVQRCYRPTPPSTTTPPTPPEVLALEYDPSGEFGYGTLMSTDTIKVPYSAGYPYASGPAGQDCYVSGPVYCWGTEEMKYRYQWDCLDLPSVSVLMGTVVISGVNTGIYGMRNAATLTPDELIRYFNDDIAEALLPLHPEYCKAQMCEGGEFEKKLGYAETYAEAQALGIHTLAGMVGIDPLNSDVKPGAPFSPAQLSFFEIDASITTPGAGDLMRRIDTFSLEQAYCSCNAPETYLYCKNGQYSSYINSMSMLNDQVKDLFFQRMKDNYLSNRNYRKQKAMDMTGSCSPCGGIRMTLIGESVFPPLFSSTGTLDGAAMDSVPGWMRDVYEDGLAGSGFSGGIPAGITDTIATIKEMQGSAQVEHIMQSLRNCAAVNIGSPKYFDILIALRAIAGTGDGSNITPDDVKTILAANSVSMTDLCNPYLAEYKLYDTKKKEKNGEYICRSDAFYTGLNTWLNTSPVKTALSNAVATGGATSAAIAIPANTTDEFLRALCGSLGITVSSGGSYTVKGYTSTVAEAGTTASPLKYYKLLLSNGSIRDTIFLTNRRVQAGDFACSSGTVTPTGAAISSFSFTSSRCAQNDPYVQSIGNGLIAGNVAFTTFTSGLCGQYVVWGHKLMMSKKIDAEGLDGCLNCVSMKAAFNAYMADSLNYKMAVYANHPLFEKTFSNYLNYKLGKRHTADDYLRLMSGCALSDQVILKRTLGTHELIFNGSGSTAINNAYAFLSALQSNFPDQYISSFTFKRTGDAVIWLDYNSIAKDKLYAVKVYVDGYTAGSPLKNWLAYTTYEGDFFVKNGCAAPSIAGATISAEAVQVKDVTGTFQNYTWYRVDATTPTPLGVSNVIQDIRTFLADPANTCSKAFATANIELMRSKDYSLSYKQNYLNYAYSLTGSPDAISDKLLPEQIKSTVFGVFASVTKLSYNAPWCSNKKEDLHYFFDAGTPSAALTRLTTTLTQVKAALGGSKLFSNTPITNIAPGSLGTGSTSLKAIRMANGGMWYRLFDAQNKRYNVYLQLSEKMTDDGTGYAMETGTSGFPNPQLIPNGDSLYRFTIRMKKGTQIVTCDGYTDYNLGAAGRLQNVVLYDNGGSDICIDTVPCERTVYNNAIQQGIMQHGQYIDSIKNYHYMAMRKHFPANSVDTLRFSTQQQQHHYTLYYYDLAGNLTRTVPPAGVSPLSITTEAANNTVDANRTAGSITASIPGHTKVSTYRYNSYNQLLSQETPDGGKTEFYYDGAGRLVFSQNAQQKLDNKCSYTLYDEQSRIKETGQFIYEDGILPAMVTNSQNFAMSAITSNVQAKIREDVVATFYDEALLALVDEPGMSAQQNLRKRVSSILYCNKLVGGTGAPNYYSYASHFSYDALGNVSTLIQDNPYLDYMKQRFKRIDYDYDLLSGKVNMVSYNRGFADQFYQKYNYDADNRITQVESSKDGLIWDRDASYTYYKHGPLAQMQVGDLNVQSVQYAYTIQGWLKAINGDVLNPAAEMGKDGNGGGLYPKDVFAHGLDYFKGDYKQIGAQAVMHTPDVTKSLYNGNIARQATAIAGGMDNLQRTYEYDQLNRLMSAQYASVHNTTYAATPLTDYRNRYEYDADGNIQKLVRKAAAGAALDSFIYSYAAGNNKLLQVDDRNVTTGGTDLKSGQGTVNYHYDAIGNLTKDRQARYGEIGWNLYGKVKHIWDTTANGQHIYYDYDGTGQRLRKDVVRFGLPGWDDDGYRNSDVYVRDATGNIMAVYKGSSRIDNGATIEWVNDDIITEHGTWETPSGFGLSPFVAWAYGGDAVFSTSLISAGISASPGWSTTKSDSYSLEFYLRNGDGLYATALQPFINYFTPMAADTAGILTAVLSANDFAASEPLMVPLLADQQTRTTLLNHLNNATPSLMIATLQNCQVQNAGGMNPPQRLSAALGAVGNQGPNYFYGAFLGAAQGQPAEPPVFYNAMVKDPGLITQPWLSANPQVINTMAGLMTAYAPRDATSWYMAGHLNTTQPGWLANSSTLDERLNISYQTNRTAFLTDYLNGLGVTPLNTTLTNLSGLTVNRYVYDLRRAVLYGGTLNPTYEPPTVSTPDPENLTADTMYLAEHHLYGSSRLGLRNYDAAEYRTVFDGTKPPGAEITENGISAARSWYSHAFADWIKPLKTSIYTGSVSNVFTDTLRERRFLGRKNYEFTDHLGNVLAVTLDRKTGYGASGGLYAGYSADLASITDYYPFGMPMPGRNKEFSDYRFGQGTQMKSDEVYGDGNLYTAQFWEYDTRTARRWNRDPKKNLHESDYAVFSLNPLMNIDPLGDKVKKVAEVTNENFDKFKTDKDKIELDEVSISPGSDKTDVPPQSNAYLSPTMRAMRLNGLHTPRSSIEDPRWRASYAQTNKQMAQLGALLLASGASIGTLAVGGSTAALYKTSTFLFKARAASALSDAAAQWYTSGELDGWKDINFVSSGASFLYGNPFMASVPGAFYNVSYNSMLMKETPIIRLPNEYTAKSILLNTAGNMVGDAMGGQIRGGYLNLGMGRSIGREFVGQTTGDAPSAIIDDKTGK